MLMHNLTIVLVDEIHGLVECQYGKFIEGGRHIFFYSRGDANIIINSLNNSSVVDGFM
jgi:hypothetical protein